MVPGGDEPHYLIITQSLLLDGDLTIEDVHRRGDYRAYYGGDLPPARAAPRPRRPDLFGSRPGTAGARRPGVRGGRLSRVVVVFLVLLAAAGSALAWHVAWLATRRADAAWFGWAAVTLPVTAIFQSFTVYPGRPRWRARAHRVVGAPARRRGGAQRQRPPRGRGCSMARRWRCCRGCTRDSRYWPACLGRAGAAAPVLDEEPCRQGGRVSGHSGGQRDRCGSGTSSRFTARPIRSAPYAPGHRIVPLRPRRPRRAALRSAVRPAHLRAGAGASHSLGLGRDARSAARRAASRSSCCSWSSPIC